MSNDKELLELAAKAYWGDEIDDVCSIRWLDADQAIGYTHADNQDHNGQDQEYVWNPLTNDGDALRLAVKLTIHITSSPTDAWASTLLVDATEPMGTDPYAATRRAIVRAAAEIGRTMP